MVKERGNYVYPHSDQASTVLELLKLELHRLGIKILTGVQVTDITPISSGFMIKLNTGKQKADAVILACGGKASSKLGSDGGYTLAKGLGHTMVPVVPALVQLKVRKNPFAKAAGVRTDASVTAICDGKAIASDRGELQLTAYGISGIPVFQIRRTGANDLCGLSSWDLPPETNTEIFRAGPHPYAHAGSRVVRNAVQKPCASGQAKRSTN